MENPERKLEVELLLALAERLSGTLVLDEVLAHTLETVHQGLAGIDSSSVVLLEEGEVALTARFVRNEKPGCHLLPLGYSMSLDESLFSRLALKNKEPVTVHDLWEAAYLHEHGIWLKEAGLRSLLYVPLLAAERPLGVMQLYICREPRHFTPAEISFCQRAAGQAARAIENANRFAAQMQELKLAQMLQKVGALLTTSLSLREVYENLFDYLAEIIEYDHAALYLEDPYTGKIRLAAKRGSDSDEDSSLQNSFAEKWLHRIPLPPGWAVISNTVFDTGWINFPPSSQIQSWIGAVLMVKDQLIGVMSVESKTPDRYRPEIGKMVSAFANQAAIAIANARLHDQVLQQTDELAILHQVAIATAVTMDVGQLLHQTTAMISSRLYPDVFGFVLIDEQSGKLIPHPSFHGLPPHYAGQPVLYESGMGLVAQTGEPRIIPDVSQDPLYFAGMPVEATRSAIIVPLLIDNVVVGLVDAESRRENHFSEKDLHFLVTLAGKVAVAMERAWLYEALLAQKDSLSDEVSQRTAELQAEQERMSAILESAGEGVVLTDTEARILYVNPALERMSGYGKEALLGQHLRLLVNRRDSQVVFDELWQTISGSSRWSGELRYERQDGSTYDVAITATPIVDAQGGLQGYVCVQLDISRLKEVDRLKSEFISNVTHDLRTPLTNIKTYASLVQRGRPENQPRYFQIIHQEIDRLNGMIQDLLDVARLDAEFEPDPALAADAGKVLRELAEFFLERAQERKLQFIFGLPAELPLVHVSPAHLRIVFSAVLENNIRYVPEGGRIALRGQVYDRAGQPFVRVQIEDNGAGFTEEELPHLFDRFYRGEAARKLNLPGTGLGLAVARKIIEQYGGLVEASNGDSGGACFTFWLPVRGEG